MWASPDRWTCSTWHRTVVIDGSQEDTAAAIDAVQRRHGKVHREARVLDAKLRRVPMSQARAG